MSEQTVLVEIKEQIALITLNRPKKLNALDLETKNLLYDVLCEIEANDEVLVAILTGAGRAFSSGHDNDDPLSCMPKFTRLQEEEKLFHLKKPIIAAVNGYALGDGLQQAMLCDMIVASEEAVFGFIGPETGGFCYGALTVLPAIVGRNVANELLLTCKRFPADEAFRIGLVNKVVPPDRLIDETIALAKIVAQLPPKSIHYTKEGLRTALASDNHLSAVDKGWKDIMGEAFVTENQP